MIVAQTKISAKTASLVNRLLAKKKDGNIEIKSVPRNEQLIPFSEIESSNQSSSKKSHRTQGNQEAKPVYSSNT